MRSLTQLGGVIDARARGEHARIHAEERELTDERVGHDLERQRRKRRLVLSRTLDQHRLRVLGVGLLVRVDPDDRRHVERRRQEVHDGVEQRLHTLVLEGRSTDDRHERGLPLLANRTVDALSDRRLDFGFGRLFPVEILLENLVVGLADLFNQLLAVVLRLVHHVGGNLPDEVVGAYRLVFVGDGFHPHEVDDAPEVLFGADWQLNRNGIGFELRNNLVERPFEVGADTVHLVHEADAGNAVLVGLPPDGLRLRLDAGNRVEYGDGAIQHAQRALDLGGEVDVPRRVDDVDAVVAPEAGGRGRGDGDPALLLLFHPVHDGRALVDFTNLVRNSGIEQNPLRRGRLAGIDVGHDADVPRLFE